MKILFITAEGFDTPNPNNQMAECMLGGFLDAGYQIHLIQSHRKGIHEDIPASLRGRAGLTVDTVVRKPVNKSNFVRRYFNDVHYAFQSKKYWRRVKDADIIYLQSNPTIIVPMLLLKLFQRKPIVYVIYDVFPGHAYSVGVVKSKLLYRIMQIVQKPCYHMADRIVVLEEDMKRKVIGQGAVPGKVRIIPAWYDVSKTREVPPEENRFLKKYGIDPSKFYVQFAGSIGYIFHCDAFLELAKRVREYPDIVIQIVGDGPVKASFVERAKEAHLDNIQFYPLQPVDLVPDVYSACSVCLIPLKKGVIGNGIPSKAAILMACRRVIINCVEKESYYSQMFVDNRMGVCVDVDDMDGLAEAVIDLYRHPEKIGPMADRAQQFGREHYSSTAGIQKFLDVFEELAE